jgi:hypothetical protein
MNPQSKRFRLIMSLGVNAPLANNPVPEPV